MVAVVASTPATDLRASVVSAIEEYSVASGLVALALAGMSRWYGLADDLDEVIANGPPQHLADTVLSALASRPDECKIDLLVDADSLEAIHAPGFIQAVNTADWPSIARWSCLLDQNSVATTAVERLRTTPVLTVYGTEDPLVVPEQQRPSFQALCAADWPVTGSPERGRYLDGEGRRAGRPLRPGGRGAGPRARRVVMFQGEVRWAALPDPTGSGPGFRRPVVVVQGDPLNRGRIGTVLRVPLTADAGLGWAAAPGNVLLETRLTGLLARHDSGGFLWATWNASGAA